MTGASLNCQRFGTGPRAVLALHCSLAHGGEWAGVAARMGDGLTVVAPDLPGHGRSPKWDGTGDYIAHCAARAAELIDGPVDLIGHSGGGVIAMQIAVARPGLIRTLTLIEPTLFAAVRGTPDAAAVAATMTHYAVAYDAGDLTAAASAFMAVWGGVTPWDRMEPRMQTYLRDRIHLIRDSEPALYEDSGGLLAEGALNGLTMPVLLIAGGASPGFIHPVTRAIASKMPDARVTTIPGAGHMCPVTHPGEVAALIADHLSRG